MAEGWQERQQAAAAARQAAELAALKERYEVRMDDGLDGRYPEGRDFTDHRVTPEGRGVSFLPERPRIWDRENGAGWWAPAAVVEKLKTIPFFADLLAARVVAREQHIADKLVGHDKTAAAQEKRAAREAEAARVVAAEKAQVRAAAREVGYICAGSAKGKVYYEWPEQMSASERAKRDALFDRYPADAKAALAGEFKARYPAAWKRWDNQRQGGRDGR